MQRRNLGWMLTSSRTSPLVILNLHEATKF
jgi:hypothetical protein